MRKEPIKVHVATYLKGKKIAERVTELQMRRRPPWFLK